MEYKTADGEPTTLYKLVRQEPDWAESRIREGEKAQQEIESLRSKVNSLEIEKTELTEELKESCPQCHSRTGMKESRDSEAYCEDCGWPNEGFGSSDEMNLIETLRSQAAQNEAAGEKDWQRQAEAYAVIKADRGEWKRRAKILWGYMNKTQRNAVVFHKAEAAEWFEEE